MISGRNPYTFGDPVGKSSSFVGRQDVLKEVLRILRHPEQNAITLYGQRRIGKTSILQYLETHLPEYGPFVPIYFDLMGMVNFPLGEILRGLARAIDLKFHLPASDLGENPEQSFRETYLPEILRNLPAETSIVLLLDEFDILADPQAEQQIKRRFYGYVRDLRQIAPKQLQFVFTLGRNPEDLDIVARALFKDLPSRRVSLLSREEMEALVRLSECTGDLKWTPEAVERVWNLTGGHPYLTQALCSHIWEESVISEGEPYSVEPEDVERAIPYTLESSQNMLVWLWDGLGPAEKTVAAALASAGPTVVDEDRLSAILAESGVRIMIGELRDAPRVLQQWDILAPAQDGYRFRVELLRRWIAENKPLSRTQEELDRINPVADNLFAAARGLYLNNELNQAEELLQRALRLNPNHMGAHELLAEILIAKGDLDGAQTLLEKLEELAPGRARLRLKQIYLEKAEETADGPAKLAWYRRILDLLPGDPQATEGYRRTEISLVLDDVSELAAQEAFVEALTLLQAIAEKYPTERDWQPDLDRLRIQAWLSEKYTQALGALQQGDLVQARRLLAEVMAHDPDYKDAGRYMCRAITGRDPEEVEAELHKLRAEITRLETKLRGDALRRTVQKRPRQKRHPLPPKEEGGAVPSLPLSQKNPLHYLRLLWWTLVNPEELQAYRESLSEDTLYAIGHRLAYTLLLTPLLIVFLGFGIGTLPYDREYWVLSPYVQPLALLLIALWGLLMLSANRVESAVVPNLSGGLAFSFALIAGVSMASNVINSNAQQSVEGSLSGLIGLLLTSSLMMGVAYGLAHHVASGETLRIGDRILTGICLGMASGVAYVTVRFVGYSVRESLLNSLQESILSARTVSSISTATGIISSIVAGIAVITGVNFAMGEMSRTIATGVAYSYEKNKPAVWALGLLVISLIALSFLSLGGLAWMQTGSWPQPAWLSETTISGP